MLFRRKFASEYDLVYAWCERLVETAKRNAEMEKQRTFHVWQELEADKARLTAEGSGYHLRRLERCMRTLSNRQNRLVAGGWSSSKFDLSLLVNAGVLAAFKELGCGKIKILKKSSNCYLSILVSANDYSFSIQFIDFLRHNAVRDIGLFLLANNVLYYSPRLWRSF